MFVGHLAAALVAKKVDPELPLSAAVAAVFGLDLIWPILVLAGVEVVRVDPGNTAFTHLAFESYPWSHSLAATLVWGLLGFVLTRALTHSSRSGWVVFILVLSHWVLDFVSHRPDLPLWPGGPLMGLGLWRSIPATLGIEGLLLALGVFAYLRAVPRPRRRTLVFVSMVALATLIWVAQPWSPPPPSAAAVAWGALALWLFVPWSHWVERSGGEPSAPAGP